MDNINHHQSAKQFIAIVEGKTATLKYEVSSDGKTLDYYSTFVPPELRGRNIGQQIVKFALDYAKANHLFVIPTCPFVKKYIDQHPEYQSVIKNS